MKCDCNFSVKIKVLNFTIKLSKIHEFYQFLKFIKSGFLIYDVDHQKILPAVAGEDIVGQFLHAIVTTIGTMTRP